MGKIIQLKLKILAKLILNKYKPEIIGITGSVGKTGAKEAVFSVLSKKYNVKRSIKNYNNEIGVPLTIIGAEAQGKSIIGWIKVFFKGLKLLLIKNEKYPEILVLEMGVDKPGDMEYLLSITKPKYGIITRIGESHLEFFKSVEDIRKEKELLIKNIPSDGMAIINADDEGYDAIINNYGGKYLSYGLSQKAQLRAIDINQRNLEGIDFKITYNNKEAFVQIPNALGVASVEAILAGSAVGIAYGMEFLDIMAALKGFKPPKGRLNIISGVKRTVIIDDTYNSSPQSCLLALETIKNFQVGEKNSKFAILGDMLELGSYTEEGHRKVGKKVFECGVDKLILVGEKSRDIARGAEEAGMKKDDIFHFPNSDDTRIFVQDRISEGDLVLVKGSQGMRMEKIVKEIMAEPLRAGELLVRQGKGWK